MDAEELKEILEQHASWLHCNGGQRADLSHADLSYADLSYANLSQSNLSKANLSHANLSHSDLGYITGYSESHEVFQEVVRRQKENTFTDREWTAIGQIIVHRLCWGWITYRFDDVVMSILEKLTQAGFREWEDAYKEYKEKEPMEQKEGK